MRIQQFIKSLNNTEIGKGGTHECYVLVSRKAENIENIFDSAISPTIIINLKNGGTVIVFILQRLVENSELMDSVDF